MHDVMQDGEVVPHPGRKQFISGVGGHGKLMQS
jgi:hypothetical protein